MCIPECMYFLDVFTCVHFALSVVVCACTLLYMFAPCLLHLNLHYLVNLTLLHCLIHASCSCGHECACVFPLWIDHALLVLSLNYNFGLTWCTLLLALCWAFEFDFCFFFYGLLVYFNLLGFMACTMIHYAFRRLFMHIYFWFLFEIWKKTNP